MTDTQLLRLWLDFKGTSVRGAMCGSTDYQIIFFLVHNVGMWSFMMKILEWNACIHLKLTDMNVKPM